MISLFFRRLSRSCQGCGSLFQHLDPTAQGFIAQNKLKNTLLQNTKAQKALEDIRHNEDIRLKDFIPKKQYEKVMKPVHQEPDTVEDIEELIKTAVPMNEYQEKPRIKPVLCMRCFKISKYGQLPPVATSLDSQAPIITLRHIFDPIKFNSVIIKVVDLIDFNGSFIKEIYELAKEKQCHLVLILNKIDALPLGYKPTRIFQWAVNETKGLFKEMYICGVSSKTGEGFDRVIKILKELKQALPHNSYYVIGATNSGKSSFINKLSEKCWDLPKEKFKKPLNQLTTSSFPGTTLTPVDVQLRSLGIRIIDTPGIPTLSQVTSKLDPAIVAFLVHNKKIKPVVLTATTQFSFWLGALARIDMVEGDFKYLTFFTSNLCTIHKTKRELAEDVYKRQAGKLLYPGYKEEVEWEIKRVEVVGVTAERAARDVVIHGLGWFSVTGVGKAVFEVHVAKGIGINDRDPLMPYEAEPGKVVNTKGRTINSEKVAKKRLD